MVLNTYSTPVLITLTTAQAKKIQGLLVLHIYKGKASSCDTPCSQVLPDTERSDIC